MLKTANPTLEIKTTGTDLSKVETMFITIKRMDFQTVKSNDDIEVDNDVISVFLTAEEASQIDLGGANAKILAYLDNGESKEVKISRVKRGSRTAGGGGSGGDSSGSSSGGGLSGIFGFEIREDGHLYVMGTKKDELDRFSINGDGHLIYSLDKE